MIRLESSIQTCFDWILDYRVWALTKNSIEGIRKIRGLKLLAALKLSIKLG